MYERFRAAIALRISLPLIHRYYLSPWLQYICRHQSSRHLLLVVIVKQYFTCHRRYYRQTQPGTYPRQPAGLQWPR